MKSTIECLQCKKESTTFDVFTNIPVSLPEPSQLLLNIIVHRLPSKLKNIVQPTGSESLIESGTPEGSLIKNYT